MLTLKIALSDDKWDDENQRFVSAETIEIELEHSLASLSKWEEIWEVPLLSSEDKTPEQNLSYLQCMCVTPNVPPEVFLRIEDHHIRAVEEYLDKKHTATWFSKQPEARSGEAITAELLYYWMSGFNINWEAQYWNLNKLLTLIKVFSVKQDNKPVQQSRWDRQREIARLNAQRLRETGSRG